MNQLFIMSLALIKNDICLAFYLVIQNKTLKHFQRNYEAKQLIPNEWFKSMRTMNLTYQIWIISKNECEKLAFLVTSITSINPAIVLEMKTHNKLSNQHRFCHQSFNPQTWVMSNEIYHEVFIFMMRKEIVFK